MTVSINSLVKGYWAHLTPRRKKQLLFLLVLMVLASFAEVLSLGAVLPFLGVLTQPERVFGYPAIQPLLLAMNIRQPNELLLPITVAFIAAALLAGSMRLFMLYVQTKLSFAIGADFSHEIYRRTLYQPYAVHVSRNSSEVISGVTSKVVTVIYYFLLPTLTLLSSAIIFVAIFCALLAVNPGASLVAIVGFGLIYGLVILTTRKRLSAYSKRISVESNRVVQVLQEGLGGIRDVLIDGTQETYSKQYRTADVNLRHAQAGANIIAMSPRYAAEALGMSFIAVLAYAMAAQSSGVANAIALLGALALGAQRLLPILQQSYQAITQLRSNRDSLYDALALLSQPIDAVVHRAKPIQLPFVSSIQLNKLGFQYNFSGPKILHDVNIRIDKGSRVGFIGATGSGKSTLLDIVMGLLLPTEGSVLIDDQTLNAATQRAWQRKIAHVPQSIYLSDASIGENIAFGLLPGEIDWGRVRVAAERAQISEYIESLPNGYDTFVGERGVRLSGGQRQRIGIARALYKQAEVVILDEATSALDNQTEREVMAAMSSMDDGLTVLMVAHRLSTLERCDYIVELQGGRIARVGSYENLIGSRPL